MKNKNIKEKLSFLPFNLFMSLSVFFGCYFLLQTVFNLSIIKSLFISFIIYINDVVHNSKSDYFESEIEKLKKMENGKQI